MKASGIFTLCIFLHAITFTLGQYEARYLRKANGNADADGVTVNEAEFAIEIDANRKVPTDRNYIAEIRYTDFDTPRIGSVEGAGVKPQLSIYRNRDKVYLQIDNELKFENGGNNVWTVRLNPPAPRVFTVSVRDVAGPGPGPAPVPGDAPRWISFAYGLEVTENNDPATDLPLFTYRAVASGFRLNSLITYELLNVPTTPGSNPPQAYFKIDATTGVLRTNAIIDAEVTPDSIEFQLVAKETNEPSHSVSEIVKIFIKDVNDNPPVITYPKADTHFEISEDLPVDNVLQEHDPKPILDLQATDADDPSTGNGQVVSFSINPDQVEANKFFKIEVIGGRSYLVVKAALEISANPIPVEIIAKDGGDPVLEGRQTLLISVVPVLPTVNEPPAFSVGTATVAFAENDGNAVANLPLAVDPDTIPGYGNAFGQVVCYFIIDGDTSNTFQLNQNTNRLSLRRLLDYETTPSYNLVILAKNDLPDDCRYPVPAPNPIDNSPSYLRVTVEVTDVTELTAVVQDDHRNRAHNSFNKVRFEKFEKFRKSI